MLLNKELCSNGISLRVKTRIALLDEEHIMDETVKFSLALFWNAELTFFEEACILMGCQKVLTDRRIFMFDNALMKVSSRIADILGITQIICKRVNNAL